MNSGREASLWRKRNEFGNEQKATRRILLFNWDFCQMAACKQWVYSNLCIKGSGQHRGNKFARRPPPTPRPPQNSAWRASPELKVFFNTSKSGTDMNLKLVPRSGDANFGVSDAPAMSGQKYCFGDPPPETHFSAISGFGTCANARNPTSLVS